MNKAVLFLNFNRPEKSRRVFERIREARPPRLYMAVDGPRPHKAGEAEQCAKVREIAGGVDWPCELVTLFREENLGCRRAVSSAIDWFFEQEEEGIILEDDCLPAPIFFRFAEEALEHYRDDERIMHINGSNFVPDTDCGGTCGYFYRYIHVWGWASWRRAWRHYDVDLNDFNSQDAFRFFDGDPGQARRWNWLFRQVRNRNPNFDTWDFQWSYAVVKQGGLSLVPRVGMVENIGFDQTTHQMADVKMERMADSDSFSEPWVWPSQKVANRTAERSVYKLFYRKQSLFTRVRNKLKRLLKDS